MKKTVRFLGAAFILAAIAAGGYDLVRWLGGAKLENLSFGALWSAIHQNSLLLLQPAIERHVDPYIGGWLWDPVILAVLTAPAWLVFAVIGTVLFCLGRSKPSNGQVRA
jgi:hypothetical protein